MTIFGMTRIRNESRWIRQVLMSMLPLCERVFVLDDGSSDGTPELCEQMSERVTVIRSPFRDPVDQGIDESRDREYLLQRVMGCVSDIHLRGNERSPYWVCALDGDEILDAAGVDIIRARLEETSGHAFKLPIRYLWDTDLSLLPMVGHRRVRVDGVYRTFARPSIFRLFNAAFRFQRTPWGGNFHCSSIPQELLHCAHEMINAPVWHCGYQDKSDRIRKFKWYSKIDGNNHAEDRYVHMIQGDGPIETEPGWGFPPVLTVPSDAKLIHAGPFAVEMM